jgi:hypothetical protein
LLLKKRHFPRQIHQRAAEKTSGFRPDSIAQGYLFAANESFQLAIAKYRPAKEGKCNPKIGYLSFFYSGECTKGER